MDLPLMYIRTMFHFSYYKMVCINTKRGLGQFMVSIMTLNISLTIVVLSCSFLIRPLLCIKNECTASDASVCVCVCVSNTHANTRILISWVKDFRRRLFSTLLKSSGRNTPPFY